MKHQKSLAIGGAYYLLYNVLNLGFPLVSGIYVAYKLVPEKIGAVAAAQNLATYFVILSFLGIPTYGLREISKERDNFKERSRIFSELFIINFISTVVFSACYILLVLSVAEYRNALNLYLIVGISVVLNIFNISWLYEGLEEFRFSALRNLVFKAIALTLLVLFVRKPDDYLIYAAIGVIGVAGNNIVNLFFSSKLARFTIKGLNFKRHLKSIFYLVAVNLAIELYSLMDVTMMNFMTTKDNIAYYKYGHGIHLMLLQLINTFTMVLVPRIAFYYREKRIPEFNQLISKAQKLIIICSVPMIVGIYFAADILLVQVYGAPYIASARILKLFSILLLVTPTGYLLGSRIMLVTGKEKMMVYCVGLGALVNLVANFILIPRYTIVGATIASILSELIVMIVYVNLGRKHFKLDGVEKTFGKVLLAALITALYLYACVKINVNPWLVILLETGGAVVYGLALLSMKEETVKQYFDLARSKLGFKS